jgi:hypothetical protein
MAKGNIDPAFQAAPFLGQSSFDPVQFIEKKNLLEYQQRKQSKLEQDRDMKEGLEKLTLDLKGWNDKTGFDVITKKHEVIRNAAIEAQRKGLNWVSPKTRSDIEAWKGVNDALTGLKQDVDMWKQNEAAYNVIQGVVKQDLAKPPDQRRIDYEYTGAALEKELQNPDLAARNLALDKIVKYNVQYGDIVKEVIANKAFFEQPKQVQTINPITNEIVMVEKLTPQQEKENERRYGILYEGFDQSYKNAIKKQRENDADPDLKVMTDKDYFISQFSLPYREKLIQKPASKSSSGDGINFGGANIKYEPTERQSFRNYTTYHPTLKWPTQNIPVDDVVVWKPNGEKVRVTKKTLQLQYTGYDENTDQLTFLTESNYYGDDTNGKGDQIAIQFKDVPPKFGELEILVEGKRVKIKDVKREKPSAPKVSYPDWKKANPSGTLDQYKAVNGL